MNGRNPSLRNIGRALLVLVILLAALPPTRAQAAGTISITPTSGPPGSVAVVTGSFPSYGVYDSVVIWWDAISSGHNLGSTSLNADGAFSIDVIIPPDAAAGTHQVYADVNYGYDQASTGFDVAQADRSAAYIYDSDATTAAAFKDLLGDNGVNTTLVQLNSVANTNFSSYDMILVGHDTGAGYDWSGSPSAREKIQNSGKPVLGLGQGGASLFEELNLYIRHGQCWTSTNETEMYAYDVEHPIWNVPYNIYVSGNNLVTIYSQGSSAKDVYMPSAQEGVLPLGRQHDDTTHYPLIEEDGRYLLWGFYDGPASMTSTGEELFINTVWYVIRAMQVDTLILTDYDRMEHLGYSLADVVALENDINNLMGLPSSTTNMTAVHKDLSDDAPTDVQTAYGNWNGNEGDVDITNAYVGAIDDYIESLKQSSYPNLYYVIIVGATEVIPMKAREQDCKFTAMERTWGLPGSGSYIHQLYSTPGPVNGWGHYLTDSIYGDLSYVDDGWGSDHELVPELAVGRLVETPAQISDLIDTYIASNARFSRSNRVSIASDDYVDSGTLAASDMGPGADDTLVAGSFDSNDVPPKLNAANDMVYVGGHGNYNSISAGGESFKAGDHDSYGDTAALKDMPNAVIATSGCHNGASFGNQLYHAPISGTTTYSEFPEEFAERLVGVYVGATGYTAISTSGTSTAAGDVWGNEKLSTSIIKHMYQDGNITAGEAFRRSVNDYVTDAGSISDCTRRIIAITTLYGIPNYRAPIQLLPLPWPVEWYWMEKLWIDPPPYVDPGPFRYRVELELPDWTIRQPGAGPEWYLEIPGASYWGSDTEPLMPVLTAGMILPPGSTVDGVEWDQAASESTTWTADGSMYMPTLGDGTGEGMVQGVFEHKGLFPDQPYAAYTTTTSGGAGTLAGLRIVPLQHISETLETTLWTKLAFTVTCQTGSSTDGDGDGLPTYWEASLGLDPNDGTGDNGADGDPDGDDLGNDQEFGRGTDPQDPDTDDDGWSDGDEVMWGADPLNPGDHPRSVFLPLVLRSR